MLCILASMTVIQGPGNMIRTVLPTAVDLLNQPKKTFGNNLKAKQSGERLSQAQTIHIGNIAMFNLKRPCTIKVV